MPSAALRCSGSSSAERLVKIPNFNHSPMKSQPHLVLAAISLALGAAFTLAGQVK
jgi:hypothetical protein